MLSTNDLECSEDEARHMSVLFQEIRKGYLDWKKTKRLPNGQLFWPFEDTEVIDHAQ